MNVCHVYQDQYPWDVRVEKISAALAQHGMTVHIVSRNRDGLSRKEEWRTGIYVHRLPRPRSAMIRTMVNFPAFFSPFWLHAITSVVRNTNARLIIVRDLPLSITAWMAGKITKRPVLLDMAENYPAMIEDMWKYRGPKRLDYLIRNPAALRSLERVALPRMDAILVVCEESAARLQKMGVPREKTYVVGNTPRLANDDKHEIAREIRDKSDFILLYVGGLEETRGLEIALRALPKVIKAKPNTLLVLVGEGTSRTMLRTLAKTLRIEERILWMGWQDQRSIPGLIRASDVCLIPHYVTAHTDTTVPNKLFDYMLQSKPVVATSAKPLAAIIESTRCGVTYSDHSPDELADRIVQLSNNKLRETLGKAGHQAVLDKYNWRTDSHTLLEAVESLVS